MKNRHSLLFSSIGVAIGLFLVVVEAVDVYSQAGSLHMSHRWPGLWNCFPIYNLFLILLIGGGGLANLLNIRLMNGHLSFGPTLGMLIGYVFSVVLLPLAVWGAILLYLEMKWTARHHQPSHSSPPPAHTEESAGRLYFRFWRELARWFRYFT